MLDKENNYNVDEQFTQDAWLQMEQMLDKEMPVQEKKKRRGAFWIWLTGLAILLLGLGIWSFYPGDATDPVIANTTTLNNESTIEKSKIEDVKSIAKTNTANTNKKQIETTNNTISTPKDETKKSISINPKDNTTTTITPTQPAYRTGRHYNSENVLPQKPKDSSSSILPPVPTSETQGAKASNLNEMPLKTKNETTEKDKDKRKEKPIASIVKPLNINALSMLSLNELTIKKRDPSLGLSVDEASSNWWKTNMNWGIEVGTQTANLQSLNGFFAGVLLDFNLNSRWFISSGIRYNYNRYETNPLNPGTKDESLFANPDTTFDTTSITGGPVPTSNEAYADINKILKTQAGFHVLSLPVTLNYRLNSKWSLNAGGQVSYLLDASQSISSSSTNSRGSLDAEAFNNNFGIAVAERITRRWDFAIRTGVRYDINDRFGTGLNYHSVLNRNKGTNEKESLQNSVLQLSLNFKF